MAALRFHAGSGKEPAVFDVRSHGLRYAPHPALEVVNPFYIPSDDRLFVLSSTSFQVLNPPAAEEADGTCWNGSWRELPMHPFKAVYLTSSAVHPDGRIFVSAKNFATSDEETYSFDTAQGWKKLGDWMPPFTGHGHFHRALNAWVGIYDDLGIRTICACDLVPPLELDGSGGGQYPCSKILCEPMFRVDCDEWHVGADLVFDGNMICLVECVSTRQNYCNHVFSHV